jgi:MoxR-like ATPase
LQNKLKKLIEALSENLVEKDEVIKLALLSMIAKENLILIGPPGTAKSEISRRLSQVIKDTNYYEYLLTKFTTPEEVFGPLSINELKKGQFKRNTEGYIPTSDIVFLDEIFKANSSILNSLLTIINEKVFHNGSQKEKAPLISLIGASNELPMGNSELEALYDRFLVRKYVDYVSDENIDALFHLNNQAFELAYDLKMTKEELNAIATQSNTVEIPSEIIEIIKSIRLNLKEKFKDNKIEFLSDRRLVRILKLLKISAFTNGRNSVEHSDLFLLKHCLWSSPENRDKISKIIYKNIITLKEI